MVLDFGTFRVAEDGRLIGLPGLLIETDAGERVLVDTGMPPAYARDPAAAGRADRLDGFGRVHALGPHNLPAAQLALAGVEPGAITHLVLTHSHIDHVGALADFAHLPVVIGAAERALPRPLYWGARQPLDWPVARYAKVEGDTALGPGLTCLSVPGHTPGQLALLVELPRTGPVLFTSDALSRPEEAQGDFAGAWDPAQARASAERLLALAEDRGAFVIWGHCPRQWPGLRKAPHGFD